MASGCPPPFGDPGEMREGFLCPLCLKDLQSFHQLRAHYEEEHSGEERDVKGQLRSKSRRSRERAGLRRGKPPTAKAAGTARAVSASEGAKIVIEVMASEVWGPLFLSVTLGQGIIFTLFPML